MMRLVWSAVGLFVAFMLGFMTDWDRLMLLEAAGYDFENLVWAAAGYTLPLTIGFGLIGFLLLRNAELGEPLHPYLLIGLCIAILVACGALASASGLGLPPALEQVRWQGNVWAVLGSVLSAYYVKYGWPLMACALAIGGAAAYHADLHFRKLRGDPD